MVFFVLGFRLVFCFGLGLFSLCLCRLAFNGAIAFCALGLGTCTGVIGDVPTTTFELHRRPSAILIPTTSYLRSRKWTSATPWRNRWNATFAWSTIPN